jgi:hypothetical protein
MAEIEALLSAAITTTGLSSVLNTILKNGFSSNRHKISTKENLTAARPLFHQMPQGDLAV